jgi:hypothetical protein
MVQSILMEPAALLSNRIIDDIIATLEHLITQYASMECGIGRALDAFIGTIFIDDLGRTHACRLLHLKWIAGQHTDLNLWYQRAYNLLGQ